MERIITLLLFILVISESLSCAPYLRTGSQQERDFGFVISCKWAEEESNCLLGNYRAGLSVTLLEKRRSKSCITKTEGRKEYEGYWGASGSFPVTKLSMTDTCSLANLYSLAILKSQISDYEILVLEEILDREKIKSLDTFVRSTTILEDLRTKAQGIVAGEISEIENELPKLYRYPIPEIEVLIVAYDESKNEDYCCSGPRVVLIKGTPYSLTGWCSYPFMRIFRLNEEYYLESGSACCGCGITIKELFKITKKGPVKVHSDGSLSD